MEVSELSGRLSVRSLKAKTDGVIACSNFYVCLSRFVMLALPDQTNDIPFHPKSSDHKFQLPSSQL